MSEKIRHLKQHDIGQDDLIENDDTVFGWLEGYSRSQISNGGKDLNCYLKDELTKAFGRQNQTWKLEFPMRLWVLSFKGEIFYVSTHKDKGTCIGIKTEDVQAIREGKKTEVIIEFLIELSGLLN